MRGGVSSEGFWDTTRLAPGEYRVRVYAGDVAGNVAIRDLDVTVVSPGAFETPATPR